MLSIALIALAAPAPAAALAPAAPPACVVMGMKTAGRKSPLDSLSMTVGGSEVKVCYGRPSANGRQIFGKLIPFGQLWRTGANEPTMLHTTGPITVAGMKVPAGSYSLYTVPGEKEWEVIVNKSTKQWGAEGGYTAEIRAQELGRAKVKSAGTAAPVEQFTITGEKDGLVLAWEKTQVKIPVSAGK